MIDITNTHLEAAILDQIVAGRFQGLQYAYVPVIDDDEWRLGVAVLNEAGYSPITGKSFADRGEAQKWADSLNDHIGLNTDDQYKIICSSMRPIGSHP